MIHTTSAARRRRPAMTTDRKRTLAAGLFYVGTFVFSIPALSLYDGSVELPGYVLGAGTDHGVLWGGLIEILTALTGIGTAVALHPILRRHAPSRAVGFVASRTLEAAMIFTGVLAVLSIHTMRGDVAGNDPAIVTTTADGLLALKDWTFLLGPGLMAAVNAICFATVMFQTRLVPRWIPTLGVVGAPIQLASVTATLFGAWEQVSTIAMLLVLPIATWELSVGLYMAIKGFRSPGIPSPTDLPPVEHVLTDA